MLQSGQDFSDGPIDQNFQRGQQDNPSYQEDIRVVEKFAGFNMSH